MSFDSVIQGGLKGVAIGVACVATGGAGVGFIALRALREAAEASAEQHDNSHQQPQNKEGHADLATA